MCRVTVRTDVRPALVLHTDFDGFVKSKAAIEPLTIQQYIWYENDDQARPVMVSCKLKSADHLNEAFGPGTITVLGQGVSLWLSHGGPPLEVRPRKGAGPRKGAWGEGRGPRGGGGAGGWVARRRRRIFCCACTMIFFDDGCGAGVGYARASRGLPGSPLPVEGLRGVVGTSSRAAVERASKAMGSWTVDFRGRDLG